ncbi:hypothetical protein J0X15_01935 [Roseibium sp. CAU 1637]|uniref:HEAT repeat domain-containing protein n=1 Tax=Roseibium limicola TaxID=2816037 RepID=A0A939EKN2_9HYPH|nr:hypothetical protein [Roseibium limicola]MBO0343965.1 hypothetical protein [Roseibium limicola]
MMLAAKRPKLRNLGQPDQKIAPAFSLSVGLIALVGSGLWGLGHHQTLSLTQLLLGHAIFNACAILWCWTLRPGGRFDSLAILLFACLGPIGGLGILIIAITCACSPMAPPNREKWYAELNQSQTDDLYADIHRKVVNNRMYPRDLAHNLSNFRDVMKRGDIGDKQRLLGVVALKYDRRFLPVILSALNDPAPSVRVQAAAAYTKLQNQFRAQRMTLEAEPFPETHAQAKRQIRQCCEVLESGFQDHSVCEALIEKLEILWAHFGASIQDPLIRAACKRLQTQIPKLSSPREESSGSQDLTTMFLADRKLGVSHE